MTAPAMTRPDPTYEEASALCRCLAAAPEGGGADTVRVWRADDDGRVYTTEPNRVEPDAVLLGGASGGDWWLEASDAIDAAFELLDGDHDGDEVSQ